MAESVGNATGFGGGDPTGPIFEPREELISLLTGMGLSRNASIKGLYFTGNYNADLAAAWIFEHQEEHDLDGPLELTDMASSDEELEDAEGYLEDGVFYKMVFVVNSSLKMGVGKVAAQVGHACLGVYKILLAEQQKHGEAMLHWEQIGGTKIVLKGTNTQQLVELAVQASALELPNYLVQDAGKTQIEEGSVTVLGIMGKSDVVDQITGSLSLL